MLTSEEILSGLTHISTAYSNFAILWHGLLYALVICLIARWRPANRMMALFSSLPLCSVSLFAWISGNPFNGTVFFLFAALLLFLGFQVDQQPVSRGRPWQVVAGVVLLIFGLAYPHFLETGSYWQYLYAAPVGLIPCPTLSVIIGLSLIFNDYQSWRWAATLVLPGLFYGVFGVFRLGVWIDTVLLAGALVLLGTALALRSHRQFKVKTNF